jgi:ABC-2 type transport system ATP-binding protein
MKEGASDLIARSEHALSSPARESEKLFRFCDDVLGWDVLVAGIPTEHDGLMSAVLELRQVSKSYGHFHAVSDLTFSVARGSVYGFLGPNGAGKTTTLRMILGMLLPDSGELSVLGSPSAIAVRGRVGYLPEEKGLYRKMTVASVIAYFATLKGLSHGRADLRARELLARYGLGAVADKKVETLSKGMGQKVQVLASIAHDPELVLFDEPFSGLDPVNQEVLEEVLRDLRSRGCTILFSTHVMAHAERLCDRLLILGGGRRLFEGTPSEAQAVLPVVITLQTSEPHPPLGSLPGVRNASDEGGGWWRLELEPGASSSAVLEACFERSLRLKRFEVREPDLHEVFVHLVGPAAREAAPR